MEITKALRFVRGKGLFLVGFVFTKGSVFLVPLLLAETLSAEEFGLFEYSLAGLGFVINALINLGVPASYPYFIVRKKKSDLLNAFSLHPMVLSSVFVFNQIGLLFGLSEKIYLSLNVAYIIANQVNYSIRLKSESRPVSAIFYDSGIYLVALVCLILFWTGIAPASLELIKSAIFIYALYYLVRAIWFFVREEKERIWERYQILLKYAVPVMFGSFLIFLITSSGRILVEHFFGMESVAVYGFYYRLSAVVVVIYQMVSILFFRDLYTANPKKLDKYYSLFFLFIGSLSLLVFYLTPLFMPLISDFYAGTIADHRTDYFLLSGQMLMWIATALNSSIIDRENQAGINNWRFLILIAATLLLLFLLQGITLQHLILLHSIVIWFAAIVQYYSLYRVGVEFRRSAAVLTAFLLVIVAIYTLN